MTTHMADWDGKEEGRIFGTNHSSEHSAMITEQRVYERGLDDLKLACEIYVERLRHEMPHVVIGKYIVRKNEKNRDNKLKRVLGLSTQKVFRKPQATVNKKELSSYKIVQEEEFVFVPTTDTWKVFAFGLNKGNGTIVVSPIYEVFATDSMNLLPEYLAIWLRRAEFDRYARYHSWGSARENFMFSDLCEVEIPIPDIRIQYSIVSIYNTYIERRELNETLKTRIRDICPILIKGSLEDAEAVA